MKFHSKRLEALRIVSFAAAVVQARNPLPALSNVKLEASKAGLSATGSDNEIWATAKCEADVSVDGCLGLPATLLKVFLERSKGETVSFEAKDTRLLIQCGIEKTELPFIAGSEFPEVKRIKGEAVDLDGESLRIRLSQVQHAQSTDTSRAILNGVLFSFDENCLNLVASDGKRLAHGRIECRGKGHYIIPSKLVSHLLTALDAEDVSCEFSENSASFSGFSWSLTGRLIDGSFPHWRPLIPEGGTVRKTKREEFLHQVKTANFYTTDLTKYLKVSLVGNKLNLSFDGNASWSNTIDAQGDDFSCVLPPDHLTDSLSVIRSDELSFRYINAVSPVIFEDKDFTSVVMVMRSK
jgi:DNA polymerase-3 subunit beta